MFHAWTCVIHGSLRTRLLWIYTDQLCHMLEKNGHQRWFHVACTVAVLTWALMRGQTRAWERGYCVRSCRDIHTIMHLLQLT